jgi:hypothetical protein
MGWGDAGGGLASASDGEDLLTVDLALNFHEFFLIRQIGCQILA